MIDKSIVYPVNNKPKKLPDNWQVVFPSKVTKTVSKPIPSAPIAQIELKKPHQQVQQAKVQFETPIPKKQFWKNPWFALVIGLSATGAIATAVTIPTISYFKNIPVETSINWIESIETKNMIETWIEEDQISTEDNFLFALNNVHNSEIKTMFSNHENIEKIEFEIKVQGGFYLLDPIIEVKQGFINTSLVSPITGINLWNTKIVAWNDLDSVTNEIQQMVQLYEVKSEVELRKLLNIDQNNAFKKYLYNSSWIDSLTFDTKATNEIIEIIPQVVLKDNYTNPAKIEVINLNFQF